MNSNENDAMRWNDVLSETNILIWYMPKTELRMRSYGTMNKGIWTADLGKIIPSGSRVRRRRANRGLRREGSCSGEVGKRTMRAGPTGSGQGPARSGHPSPSPATTFLAGVRAPPPRFADPANPRSQILISQRTLSFIFFAMFIMLYLLIRSSVLGI